MEHGIKGWSDAQVGGLGKKAAPQLSREQKELLTANRWDASHGLSHHTCIIGSALFCVCLEHLFIGN